MAAIVAVLVLLVAAPSAGASDDPANVQWETLLPALPSGVKPQPHSVPYCHVARQECIDTEIRRMLDAQHSFGCDHRGVFATTYLTLTRVLRSTVRRNPHFFHWPRYLYYEDALFADVYFNTLRNYSRHRPIPPAWQIAFDTARSGQVNGAQDMLLGINAHVQNDMPFVVAALGVRTKDGRTRKPDHDAVNKILDAAYGPVVHAIARRYDPFVSTTNSDLTPFDDIGGLEMVKEWREQVWRNAERLVNAKSAAERAQIATQIQQYAAGWARMMAAPQTPGARAKRDAYCKQRLHR